MANVLAQLLFMLLLGLVGSATRAAVYTVGDRAGWDVSADLDMWVQNKSFLVGDVLLFTYSAYHSVNEVTKPDYESCTVGDPLFTAKDGNTSMEITKMGPTYYTSGNTLYCLGGMKMQVDVDDPLAPAASPPAEAPPPSVTGDGLQLSCRGALGVVMWMFLLVFVRLW